MQKTITQHFQEWLDGGGESIGQIFIDKENEKFFLYHIEDKEIFLSSPRNLHHYKTTSAARDLSRYTESRHYRPLKSAPDLARGWVICLSSIALVREALDYFYPAMLGLWFKHRYSLISFISLRDKLNRQTGMYRKTRSVGTRQAQEAIATTCSKEKCLKHILWNIENTVSVDELEETTFSNTSLNPQKQIPLLCVEACNILVNDIRKKM